MRNFKTAQKSRSHPSDYPLAFEVILHVRSGVLITLRATETGTGLIWAYELGTAAKFSTAGVVVERTNAQSTCPFKTSQ